MKMNLFDILKVICEVLPYIKNNGKYEAFIQGTPYKNNVDYKKEFVENDRVFDKDIFWKYEHKILNTKNINETEEIFTFYEEVNYETEKDLISDVIMYKSGNYIITLNNLKSLFNIYDNDLLNEICDYCSFLEEVGIKELNSTYYLEMKKNIINKLSNSKVKKRDIPDLYRYVMN